MPPGPKRESRSRIDALHERVDEEPFGGEETALELAAAEGLSFETTEAFAENDLVPGIGRNVNFSSAAFGLEENAWSAPVRIASGWALLALLEVLEPRDAEYAEVEADVRDAVREEKQNDLLFAALSEAHERLTAGASLDDVASDFDANDRRERQLRAAPAGWRPGGRT